MFISPLRAFKTSLPLEIAVKNVAIIGSGLMGSGIAQVSAEANLSVKLVDINEGALKNAKKGIEKSIGRVAKKKFAKDESAQKQFVESAISKISITSDLKEAVQDADLVIEAIIEKLDLKKKLFADIENVVSSKTLLATNTSSLKLSDIGGDLKHKERFGGLHFFSPVPMMKLLEIVRFEPTSDETFQSFVDYGKQIGKVTVACKDTPGFIVNRLLFPYALEAFKLMERGDASKEDIDTAMKLGANHPMGPFELADYVGLDVVHFIMDGWHKQYPNQEIFKPSQTLNKLVAEGKLGRKTGEGFYKY